MPQFTKLWFFFLSAVNSLMTAPIHHRGSNGEQLTKWLISLYLFWWSLNVCLTSSFITFVFLNYSALSQGKMSPSDQKQHLNGEMELALSPDLSPKWPASPVWPCHPLLEVWGEGTGPCRKPLPHSQRVGCGPQDHLGHWSGLRFAGKTPKKQHNV